MLEPKEEQYLWSGEIPTSNMAQSHFPSCEQKQN